MTFVSHLIPNFTLASLLYIDKSFCLDAIKPPSMQNKNIMILQFLVYIPIVFNCVFLNITPVVIGSFTIIIVIRNFYWMLTNEFNHKKYRLSMPNHRYTFYSLP